MEKLIHELHGACSHERALVVESLVSSSALSVQSLPRVIDLVRRFYNFCERVFDISSLAEVSAAQAAAFVRAPTPAGEPALATMHMRRSVLRLLFRTARQLGLADSDPTLDLVLPPRSSMTARPLTDEEVALCRSASLHTLTATLRVPRTRRCLIRVRRASGGGADGGSCALKLAKPRVRLVSRVRPLVGTR